LNPLINNLVPPSVASVFPASGTTNYPTNGVIVVRFSEPLLAGVDLASAQKAINTALPAQSNFSAANALAAAQVHCVKRSGGWGHYLDNLAQLEQATASNDIVPCGCLFLLTGD
jgi:hypothetical protein